MTVSDPADVFEYETFLQTPLRKPLSGGFLATQGSRMSGQLFQTRAFIFSSTLESVIKKKAVIT